jgi:hypothetical protein
MDQKRKQQDIGSRNQEGNRTAARRYDEPQRPVAPSGRVADKGRDAEKALEMSARRELQHSEAIGKRHEAAGHPEITRTD